MCESVGYLFWLHPHLIFQILEFQESLNLISQEHTQMCLIKFLNQLAASLDISRNKKTQQLILILQILLNYCFEVLWPQTIMFIVSHYLQSSQENLCLQNKTTSKTPYGFLSLQESVEFYLNPVYPTMVQENFQMFDVPITGKYICKSKNPNIFTPQSSYHQSPDRKILPIPPGSIFYVNMSPYNFRQAQWIFCFQRCLSTHKKSTSCSN